MTRVFTVYGIVVKVVRLILSCKTNPSQLQTQKMSNHLMFINEHARNLCKPTKISRHNRVNFKMAEYSWEHDCFTSGSYRAGSCSCESFLWQLLLYEIFVICTGVWNKFTMIDVFSSLLAVKKKKSIFTVIVVFLLEHVFLKEVSLKWLTIKS